MTTIDVSIKRWLKFYTGLYSSASLSYFILTHLKDLPAIWIDTFFWIHQILEEFLRARKPGFEWPSGSHQVGIKNHPRGLLATYTKALTSVSIFISIVVLYFICKKRNLLFAITKVSHLFQKLVHLACVTNLNEISSSLSHWIRPDNLQTSDRNFWPDCIKKKTALFTCRHTMYKAIVFDNVMIS